MSKEMLKNDIKIMLCRLTDMIEDGNSNYSSIVSKIHSELDTLTPLDLFVTREYMYDALSNILASTVIDEPETQPTALKEAVSLTSANLKVVPDSAGNFFVMTNENGQDKIIFQTNDKTKADEYVKTNSMNPAIAAPVEENPEQELTDVPTDDLPNTKAEARAPDADPTIPEEPMPEDQPMEEPIEEPENPNVERMDVVIQKGNDLLSAIENSIDVVPDLNAITELVTIKVAIQDKIDAISTSDPSDPKLDQMLSSLESMLEQVESQAIDTINKNAPGAEVDEPVPAEEVKEKVEQELEPEVDEMEIPEEDEEPAMESVITEGEEFEAEGEVDEETGKVDLAVKDNVSEDAPSADDVSDALDSDEDFEDEDLEDLDLEEDFEDEKMEESNLESLIDELVSIAEESGADPERLDEIKENIYQELDSSDGDMEEDFDDELGEFEEVPEDEGISSHDLDEFDGESMDEPMPEETPISPDVSEVPSDEEVEQVDGQIEESVRPTPQPVKAKMDPFDLESLEEEEIPQSQPISPIKSSTELIPEDQGVMEISSKEIDPGTMDELPLEGKNPLESNLVAGKVLSPEEFLEWHDNQAQPGATLDKVYRIFKENGFTEEDFADDCYSKLDPEDKEKISNMISGQSAIKSEELIPEDKGVMDITSKAINPDTDADLPTEGKNPLTAEELIPEDNGVMDISSKAINPDTDADLPTEGKNPLKANKIKTAVKKSK